MAYTKDPKQDIDKVTFEKIKDYLITGDSINIYDWDSTQTLTTSGGLTESNLNQAAKNISNYSSGAYFSNMVSVDEASTRVKIPLTDGSILLYEKQTGEYTISEPISHTLTSSSVSSAPLRGHLNDALVRDLFGKIEGSDFKDLPYLIDPLELKLRTEIGSMSYNQAEKMMQELQKWRKKAQLSINKAKKPYTEVVKSLKKKVNEAVVTINILSEHLGNLTSEAKYVKKVTIAQANAELKAMMLLNKKVLGNL